MMVSDFLVLSVTLYFYLSSITSYGIIIETRWTFFRVKLIFECDFEISWSLGPLDLGTLGPWDSWTSSLLQHLILLLLDQIKYLNIIHKNKWIKLITE